MLAENGIKTTTTTTKTTPEQLGLQAAITYNDMSYRDGMAAHSSHLYSSKELVK